MLMLHSYSRPEIRATMPFLSWPITVMKSSSLSIAGCLEDRKNRKPARVGATFAGNDGGKYNRDGRMLPKRRRRLQVLAPTVIGDVTFAAGGRKADPCYSSPVSYAQVHLSTPPVRTFDPDRTPMYTETTDEQCIEVEAGWWKKQKPARKANH